MKILVTGANGQLGSDVVAELYRRDIQHKGVDICDFDITDEKDTFIYINSCKPTAVIHCAAYTSVDKAEDESELCCKINVEGTCNIANVCKKINAALMYISSDYVFSGEGEHFHKPQDTTFPVSVYGKSKLAGEQAVQRIMTKYFIVRTSWVFGKNGGNFVETILRLGKKQSSINVVADQIGSPTYTMDLASLLCDMINTDRYGIYHATNEGVCSWAEFAREIFTVYGVKVKVEDIPSLQYPTKVIRPLNSRLDKSCLDSSGFCRLPSWTDALQRYRSL